MADSNIAKKDVTFTFGNNTSRKVSINNFNPQDVQNAQIEAFKVKIKAFNDSDVSLVNTAYFSNPDDDGNVYPVTGISDANVTITEKTVIYAKTESARLTALNEVGGDE